MDNDVSLHDLVELFVASLTSPRSSKTESGCKRYAHFHIAISAVFCGAEVPARSPEIPALGSSGRCPGISGPIFHPRIFSKSFRRFSLEGFRNFAPEVSPEISEGPEISALGPEVLAQEIFG